MQDEVAKVASAIETAAVGGCNLAAIVIAVQGAERIDPPMRNASPVLSHDIPWPASAVWKINMANEIVGLVTYNTHGSFVARQEDSMLPSHSILSISPSFLSATATFTSSSVILPRLDTLKSPVIPLDFPLVF